MDRPEPGEGGPRNEGTALEALAEDLEERGESPLQLTAEEERYVVGDIGAWHIEGDEPFVEEVETLHLPVRRWVSLWGSGVLVIGVLVSIALLMAPSGPAGDYVLGSAVFVRVPPGWSVAGYKNHESTNYGTIVVMPKGDVSSALIVHVLPYVDRGSPETQLQWYLDHDAPELRQPSITSGIGVENGPWGNPSPFDRDVYAGFIGITPDGTHIVGNIQVLTGPDSTSALCEEISTSGGRFQQLWPTFSTMVGLIRAS